MTGVLIKRRNLDTETHDQGECWVKTEVMLTHAKELPEPRREAWKRLSWSLQRQHGLSDALVLGCEPAERSHNECLLFKPRSV